MKLILFFLKITKLENFLKISQTTIYYNLCGSTKDCRLVRENPLYNRIAVKMLSMSAVKRQTIMPDEFRSLAKEFHVELPEKFLYDKEK